MGDFFEDVKKGDMSAIMGKSYPYKDNIKTYESNIMNS